MKVQDGLTLTVEGNVCTIDKRRDAALAGLWFFASIILIIGVFLSVATQELVGLILSISPLLGTLWGLLYSLFGWREIVFDFDHLTIEFSKGFLQRYIGKTKTVHFKQGLRFHIETFSDSEGISYSLIAQVEGKNYDITSLDGLEIGEQLLSFLAGYYNGGIDTSETVSPPK